MTFGETLTALRKSKGLSQEQKEFLDLLFEEFTAPTGNQQGLSAKQIEIIRKLVLIFSND